MFSKRNRTNHPMARFLAVFLCFVTLSSFRIQEVLSFQQRTTRKVFSAPTNANNKPAFTSPIKLVVNYQHGSLVSSMVPPENENEPVDNFDGEGFANYLLPYALALVGSVAATAAIFKFVLLDY